LTLQPPSRRSTVCLSTFHLFRAQGEIQLLDGLRAVLKPHLVAQARTSHKLRLSGGAKHVVFSDLLQGYKSFQLAIIHYRNNGLIVLMHYAQEF